MCQRCCCCSLRRRRGRHPLRVATFAPMQSQMDSMARVQKRAIHSEYYVDSDVWSGAEGEDLSLLFELDGGADVPMLKPSKASGHKSKSGSGKAKGSKHGAGGTNGATSSGGFPSGSGAAAASSGLPRNGTCECTRQHSCYRGWCRAVVFTCHRCWGVRALADHTQSSLNPHPVLLIFCSG